MSEDYQRRYVAYAKAHGRTPEDQEVHDKERWPESPNTGFQLWVADRRVEWIRATGNHDPVRDQDPVFDAWLAEKTRADAAEECIAEIKRRIVRYRNAGASFPFQMIPDDAPGSGS